MTWFAGNSCHIVSISILSIITHCRIFSAWPSERKNRISSRWQWRCVYAKCMSMWRRTRNTVYCHSNTLFLMAFSCRLGRRALSSTIIIIFREVTSRNPSFLWVPALVRFLRHPFPCGARSTPGGPCKLRSDVRNLSTRNCTGRPIKQD
jgi:hypothetical protein